MSNVLPCATLGSRVIVCVAHYSTFTCRCLLDCVCASEGVYYQHSQAVTRIHVFLHQSVGRDVQRRCNRGYHVAFVRRPAKYVVLPAYFAAMEASNLKCGLCRRQIWPVWFLCRAGFAEHQLRV